MLVSTAPSAETGISLAEATRPSYKDIRRRPNRGGRAVPTRLAAVPARSEITVLVPAKINIGLAVGPRQDDGFHGLQTVFAAVSRYDTVRVRPAPEISLTLTGPESSGLAADPSNLAWRAAEAIGLSAAIEIDKQIPVAAGLAGGSADAAGVLLAAAGLADRAPGELTAAAAGLGSDVTFALTGGLALGEGRGERITPLVGPPLHWVLVFADGGLSTPAVYARLDEQRGDDAGAPVLSSDLLSAVATGDVDAMAALLRNDLQPAALALAPALADTLEQGRSAGALAGQVSGSGPTCMFLARDADHAGQLAAALSGAGRGAVAVRSGVRPEVM